MRQPIDNRNLNRINQKSAQNQICFCVVALWWEFRIHHTSLSISTIVLYSSTVLYCTSCTSTSTVQYHWNGSIDRSSMLRYAAIIFIRHSSMQRNYSFIHSFGRSLSNNNQPIAVAVAFILCAFRLVYRIAKENKKNCHCDSSSSERGRRRRRPQRRLIGTRNNEMKWNEMNWIEMKWNEMKWNEI